MFRFRPRPQTILDRCELELTQGWWSIKNNEQVTTWFVTFEELLLRLSKYDEISLDKEMLDRKKFIMIRYASLKEQNLDCWKAADRLTADRRSEKKGGVERLLGALARVLNR